MPTAIHPDRLSPEERLDEIAEILAAGFLRLTEKRRLRTALNSQQNSLDSVSTQSLHGEHEQTANHGVTP
ncbi:hypothetical protein [Magnetofaba australis]|uniref:Uncharacterized protein n=1 Tax=Magnetofaba australis IT-1 TaxID=1434232 RepID=A0A1Y2K9G6_9PROT|nr:hypothetical protein [Magnetofaba australis]OSM07382.1 hypothetical protein MAIT1_05031 [Magnetofaba australis IT-1]